EQPPHQASTDTVKGLKGCGGRYVHDTHTHDGRAPRRRDQTATTATVRGTAES
ncbi:hypothetical protein ALC62_13085, partial [Cyphomyrmex costatus]